MVRAGRNIYSSVQPHHWCPSEVCQASFWRTIHHAGVGLSDQETVEQIREHTTMQFFLGFVDYSSKASFDPSIIVHFRKRFSEEDLKRINELIAKHCKGIVIDAVPSL
jgi:IS5 family transposase